LLELGRFRDYPEREYSSNKFGVYPEFIEGEALST